MIKKKITREQKHKLFDTLYHQKVYSKRTGYEYKIIDAMYKKNEPWIKIYNYFTESYEWRPLDGFNLAHEDLLIKVEVQV